MTERGEYTDEFGRRIGYERGSSTYTEWLVSHVWTAEEVREVAREEGIDVSDCALGTICSAPTPLSREQIVEGLRMLSGVLIDTGEWRHNFS